MKHDCIETIQLATVMKLPADDPRRRHLQRCPRCASRLLIYQRCLSAVEDDVADPEAADEHLSAVMKAAIAGNRERDVFNARVTRRVLGRPVWVVAALFVLAAAVYWWKPWTTDQTVLRGPGLPPQVRLEGWELLPGQNVQLAWRGVAGADGYLVHLRSASLEPIAVFGPVSDTTYAFHPDSLPPGTPRVLLWRVIAVRSGDEIGRSQPASLELP